MLCCRLSPSDIHRLHASVSGRVVRVAQRGTRFMASEFAAVHSHMDIMSENDRIVMPSLSLTAGSFARWCR
jgi:phosphatidylserine decarboxylase